MSLNDIPDTGAPPAQQPGPMDFSNSSTPAAPQVQYDADGYPLPTAEQIAAFHATTDAQNANGSYNQSRDSSYQYGNAGAGAYGSGNVAYDPSLPAPKPASENPYPPDPPGKRGPHFQWTQDQQKLQSNATAKQAWQKAHESQKQAPAAAGAAPTPFQSSGVDLTKQGKGESYIDSILAHYQDAGIPQVGNQSQTTLNEFRNSQPADMSPYYDQASKLTSAKIDNAMSARGSYGSSNATGQIGAAEVALRAQQAKDEAGYGLQRFAQEGSLAGAADQQQDVGNGIQYQWTRGLADMAGQDQQMGQDRNQNLWNNNFQLAAAKAGIYGAGASATISDVGAATDASHNAGMGAATDSLSNANTDANTSNAATAGLQNAANTGVSNYIKFKAGRN